MDSSGDILLELINVNFELDWVDAMCIRIYSLLRNIVCNFKMILAWTAASYSQTLQVRHNTNDALSQIIANEYKS